MQIDLTKQKWTLRGWRPNYWHRREQVDGPPQWQPDIGPIKATIPGSAQTALLAARLLPNWNVGLNSLACEWVENRQWEFRTTLKALKPTLRESVILHCDGLDYSGWIAVDTKVVGEFRGTLLRHQFDLTNFVSDGKPHELCIVFDVAPPEQGQVGWTSKSKYFKPRYSYSWDWCPRFVPIGIWDKLWIEMSAPKPRVVKVLTSLAEDLKMGRVNVFISNPSDQPASIKLSFSSHGRKSVDARSAERTVEQSVPPGDQVVRLDNIAVEPWYPNGSGAQPLYELTVEADGEQIDNRNVGFKRIHWLPNKDAPANARPMVCEINGKPTFLQGVNWAPMRMDFHHIPPSAYAKRIRLYQKMGCNVLRVWGGAYLERQVFYDLCDKAGLLVWQEFPLSSSGIDNYAPEAPDAIRELEKIATDYIHRRGHHACKLLWCGGNELQTLPNEKKEEFPLTEAHPALAAMKKVVEREDPETRYLPTSPAGPTFYALPENMGKGIHHHVHGPWMHDSLEKARAYFEHDDATFRSETGMPGATSLPTLKKYAGNQKLWPVNKSNPFWAHTSLWWLQDHIFNKILRSRKPAAALREYIKLSQKLQADVLELAGRKCKSRFPACSGFLIWTGHDAFPSAANTSVIDYDDKLKPGYHALARVFKEPVIQEKE